MRICEKCFYRTTGYNPNKKWSKKNSFSDFCKICQKMEKCTDVCEFCLETFTDNLDVITHECSVFPKKERCEYCHEMKCNSKTGICVACGSIDFRKLRDFLEYTMVLPSEKV